VLTVRSAPRSFILTIKNKKQMAGNPKTPKSTAPGYARAKASTKGVRVGVNNNNVKPNVPTMKRGGMKGKR
jgi:hypothetical protein